jgi:hypothetical protein
MTTDILIAISALVIALLGTLSHDLSEKWKKVLVGAASIAFAAGIAKAASDDREREFLKTALTSTLIPTNREMGKIEDEFDWEANQRLLDDGSCHHSSDGDICFYWSKEDPYKKATLVFDRGDLAEVYAKVLQGGHTRRLIKDRFDHEYKLPSNGDQEWDDEFIDKVGLLATGICFSKNKSWANAEYNYDPSIGIDLKCGDLKTNIATNELIEFHHGISWDVFNKLDERIRRDFQVQSEKEIQAKKGF